MKQCFNLLEKYILENATEYEVIDKNELEEKGEAVYYKINRKCKYSKCMKNRIEYIMN